jgi:hypothetical protein
MLMPRLVWVFGEAGALVVRSVSIAAVSMNAVSSRLYGLAQPVSNSISVLYGYKLLLIHSSPLACPVRWEVWARLAQGSYHPLCLRE